MFLNENGSILIQISLKIVSYGSIDSIEALLQVMAWYRKSGQPLPATMLTKFNDDVIKWKHFPRYWPFVRVIHRSPVNSLHTKASDAVL